MHYLVHGAASGLPPHPLFDSKFYQQQYLASHRDVVDPLEHYLTKGADKDFAPIPDFDSNYYRGVSGLEKGTNPLIHYVVKGRQEGLSTKPVGGALESGKHVGKKPN